MKLLEIQSRMTAPDIIYIIPRSLEVSDLLGTERLKIVRLTVMLC